jgi:hypothetical protein
MPDTEDNLIFRQARDAARKRLREVEGESRKLENEKLSLQATVASLDELLEDGEPVYANAFAEALSSMAKTADNALAAATDPLYGLTESCRQVLAIVPNTGAPAAEVVRMLEARGFKMNRYANPVSAVHTVLTRMCSHDEAKIVSRTPGGRPLYAPTKRKMGELQSLASRRAIPPEDQT